MSKSNSMKPLALAMGAAFVTSLAGASVANAAENPFGMTELSNGYMVAESKEGKCGGSMSKEKMKEGKCGGEKAKKMKEGKCGEGKCGEGMKKAEEAKSKMKEGKCGEGKCGEGMKKAGEAKEKMKEGKCGEGKCGGMK